MYVNFTTVNNWSNITIISDGFSGVYWNDAYSQVPEIAISTNQVHMIPK